MGRMNFKVQMIGADEVQRNLGRLAARRLRNRIEDDIEDGVDRMAEASYDNAPVETGALRASILASIRKEGTAEYIFGSHLPYARRQEYEHKTKKAYFRRAVWGETPKLHSKIGFTIRNVTGG